MEFTVRKVPTQQQALEHETAWVGVQHGTLDNIPATIQGEEFVLKTSKWLTANEVALNGPARRRMRLGVGTVITVTTK